jgi:hypothetical protein
LAKSTNHEAPRYALFAILPAPHLPSVELEAKKAKNTAAAAAAKSRVRRCRVDKQRKNLHSVNDKMTELNKEESIKFPPDFGTFRRAFSDEQKAELSCLVPLQMKDFRFNQQIRMAGTFLLRIRGETASFKLRPC